MTYAFYFDARFCSGCKACQAACKDKNNLPAGVLWRRVIEVSGGGWQRHGSAWENTVFAYNLSLACNHCIHPKCAGVCPTGAYVLREDGVVFLDSTKCMGCGYCAWACPYGVPQYDPEAGCMTKCDFCIDQLEQGLPPACVAACPMRVLDYGEATAGRGIALWDAPSENHPFPLPAFSHTQPHLAVKPHPAMNSPEKKYVANLEEIRPRLSSQWEDLPLMLFTLLAQIAVGGFWAMSWMFPPLWATAASEVTWLRLLPGLLIGVCLAAGMLASFTHLGRKRNAWRALRRVRKSSLSREILFAALFGLGWLITLLESMIFQGSAFEWTAVTAIFGIGLIYNMSQVYRFPAAPGWHTWRTNAGFMVSAALLGLSIMAPILAYESGLTGLRVSSQWMLIGSLVLILLLSQTLLIRKHNSGHPSQKTRVELIFAAMALTAVTFVASSSQMIGLSAFTCLVVLVEETLGRWIFYQSRMDVNPPA